MPVWVLLALEPQNYDRILRGLLRWRYSKRTSPGLLRSGVFPPSLLRFPSLPLLTIPAFLCHKKKIILSFSEFFDFKSPMQGREGLRMGGIEG